MEALTFGEQVKIILGRKGMTIKELAEIIEGRTGKKMSRQNLTQRLGRDNFQEQDMRMIADVLGCPFYLSMFSGESVQEDEELEKLTKEDTYTVPEEQRHVSMESEKSEKEEGAPVESEKSEGQEDVPVESEKPGQQEDVHGDERDMTIGELYEMHEELEELEADAQKGHVSMESEIEGGNSKEASEKFPTGEVFLRKKGTETQEQRKEGLRLNPVQESLSNDHFQPVIKHDDVEEDRELGDLNPYTGREFQSNSVRMHPGRIGYVQVYDRATHKWTDMTEWAFLGYQERKKALLGKNYEPPIYLD